MDEYEEFQALPDTGGLTDEEASNLMNGNILPGSLQTPAGSNPLSGLNLGSLLSAGAGGLAGLLGKGSGSSQRSSGYQGRIPSLTANRQQLPIDYDSDRRPGSAGRRYFTDMAYSQNASAPTFAPTTPATPTRPTTPSTSAPVTTPPTGSAPNWTQTINDIYQQTFGRQADPSGIATYTNLLNQGMTGEQMRESLKNSAEGQSMGLGSISTPTAPVTQPPQNTAPPQEEYVNDLGGAAKGGLIGLAQGGSTGYYLGGGTDGMADKIPATIANKQPAKLSHGEFVISADVVSALGSGNSQAGAKVLYDMMDRVRKHAHGTKKQIKPANPQKTLPA